MNMQINSSLSFAKAVTVIGSGAGMAVSSFVLSLLLIYGAVAEDYGFFAFLLVIQAFSNAIANAVIGSPLLISLDTKTSCINKLKTKSTYLALGIVIATLSALIQAGFTFYYKNNITIMVAYLLSSFLVTIRWIGAIYCNNIHRHSSVVRSDAFFTILSLIGSLFLYCFDLINLLNISFLLGGSTFFAMLLLDKDFFLSLNFKRSRISTKKIRVGWARQGKHSLLSVLTNEATINSHSYIVVFLFGTGVFAPIAAATLLFRPVLVVITSLTQVERPRARQVIKYSGLSSVMKSLSRFYILNIVFYFLNFIAVFFIIVYFMDWFWKDKDSIIFLYYSIVLIAISRLFRVMSCSYRVILQAANMFKKLSEITAITAIVSVPVVIVTAIYTEPYMTLLGIVLGEIVSLYMLRQAFFKALNGENK